MEPVQSEVKTCSTCKVEKLRCDFHKNRSSKDGLVRECKTCRKTYYKAYYESLCMSLERREKLNTRSRKYRRSDRGKVRSKRYYATEKVRIRTRACNRIAKVLGEIKRADTSSNLLGCNVDELMEHLKSKFTEGMSFDNYGEWHMDHVIPCCAFDLTKPEEQYKCFHYTNIQPLWAKDNEKKGGKLPDA